MNAKTFRAFEDKNSGVNKKSILYFIMIIFRESELAYIVLQSFFI